MKHDILYTILLFFLFIQLFIVAEIINRRYGVKTSYTRKLVQCGVIILTLSFPLALHSLLAVAVLCVFFGIILYTIIRAQLLQSLEGMNHPPVASLLYPMAVLFCFGFYRLNNNLLCFYLPVLTLVVCDPFATLIGSKWPVGSFLIRYNKKTLSGSFAFFIAALCVTAFLLYAMTDLPSHLILKKTIFVAALTSLVETVSIRGIDNLTIPATVLFCLNIQI